MSSAFVHVTGTDVARAQEGAFVRWYDRQHLPAVVAERGCSGARRYECLEGEPRHLTIFDLDDAPGRGVWPAPFRDPSFSRWVRDHHARTYRRIHAAGEDPARAELINAISVDVVPEHAEAFSRWYNDVHVPEIVACPGWRGARRYESVDGDPRFLAIYGLDDAERPFATPEYEAAVGWDDQLDGIRGYHGFRIFRLRTRIEAA